VIDSFLLAHNAASPVDRSTTFRRTVMLPSPRVCRSENNVYLLFCIQPTVCVNVCGSEVRSVHCRKIDVISRVPKILQFDSWFTQYAHCTLLESRRPGEIRSRTSEICFKMGVSGVGRESVDCMYVCGSRRCMLQYVINASASYFRLRVVALSTDFLIGSLLYDLQPKTRLPYCYLGRLGHVLSYS
jgi:hypothetical protein